VTDMYQKFKGRRYHYVAELVALTAQLAADMRSVLFCVPCVSGSIPEKQDGRMYNTCTVFSPTGNLIAKHRKVWLSVCFCMLMESVLWSGCWRIVYRVLCGLLVLIAMLTTPYW